MLPKLYIHVRKHKNIHRGSADEKGVSPDIIFDGQPQPTAAGQEKKGAATGDNEQLLEKRATYEMMSSGSGQEAPSLATGASRKSRRLGRELGRDPLHFPKRGGRPI